MINKPEILAPAGDMECLKTAFRFGADAAYIGGPIMQLRSGGVGFDLEGIETAVRFSHENGKKLYVAVNSFAFDRELGDISEYVKRLYDVGTDAVIVSDLGVLYTARKAAPGLEVHISTQANCQNSAAATVYSELGAKRAVLAREMSLEDIKEFTRNVPEGFETEAFVHGAMCMAYSGRCFISSFLSSRSGNRGECTQPCRWKYHLSEQNRPGEFFAVESDGESGTTILSSRDLCCIDFLDEIAAAGVCSFKIEGRMKSPYYVATVVNAYRHAVDKTADIMLLKEELNAVSHRPYCSGFYFGELKKYSPDTDMAYEQSRVFVGVVTDYKNGRVTIKQRGKFEQGDTIEVVSPDSIGLSFTATGMCDEKGNMITSAPHAEQIVTMDCPFEVSPGDILRK